jgi:hypothetical protein
VAPADGASFEWTFPDARTAAGVARALRWRAGLPHGEGDESVEVGARAGGVP